MRYDANVAARTPSGSRPIVVYDGSCGMCRRSVRLVQRLDWLHRFDLQAYDDAIRCYPEVARGVLDDGLRVRFPNHTVTVGMPAVRSIGMRLPATMLGAWLLYLPGFSWLGAKVYRWISRHRTRDASGSCHLPNAR
jgi:predicted DCC family thiol-disulfide oxidoreductase YuxK